MPGLRLRPSLNLCKYQQLPSSACYRVSSRPTFRSYATASPRRSSRTTTILISSTVLLGAGLGYLYATDTRSSFHWWLTVPLARTIWPDAEDAHESAVDLLKGLYRFGLHPRERGNPDNAGDLEIEVFGHKLTNPLGISAGLDKHAEIPTQLLALGPAVVEVGGITPHPQSGNPKPRVFRIISQKSMINRYGLNSDGAELVAARLRQRVREFAYSMGYGYDDDAERFVLDGEAGVPPGSLVKGKLMAVQVAKNEFTPDGDIEAIKRDYVSGTSLLARYADIIVVNVSCPNAPGYRELQQIEPLTNILTGVVRAAASTDRKSKPAVMVKVSPDEDTEEQVASICAAVWASDVDGVIVGNTTKRRPVPFPTGTSLSRTEASIMKERGGYSGPQLFLQTVDLVKKYRRILDYPLHNQDLFAQSAQESPAEATDDKIKNSVERDARNLKPPENTHKSQPLLRIPERHSTSGADTPAPDSAALSASHHLEQGSTLDLPEHQRLYTPKVIFCTGGITNGQQALEVLEAGASVAQIYTALVYGGAGKITSMKQEMRQEIRKSLELDVLGA